MSFWRKQDPILDRHGQIIKGGMWSHQRAWWGSPKFIKALITGYGGGKTFIGSKRAISTALHNAPVPTMYVSPSYKVAKRTVIPTIRSLLDGKGINYTENKSDHEFIILHGGRKGIIWVGSGDDPGSLKGPNLGCALIDEPFIQSRAVFDQMLARVRDPKAKLREIALTGTPEELNWGYDICEGDEKVNFDIEVIQDSSLANKALPDDFVQTLMAGYDEKMVQAYVDGLFVNMSHGAIYYSYDEKLNFTDNVIDPDRPIDIGMDFNVNPMTAEFSQQAGTEVHVCDEIVLQHSNTPELCEEIKSKYPNSIFNVYPDSSGKSKSSKGTTDFQIIKEVLGDQLEKMHYPPKNPRLKDRFNAVNGMLCNAKKERKLFINKAKCPELVKDFRQTTAPYEEFKKKNPKRTHASDALGYKIHRKYPYGERPRIVVS